MIAFVEKGLRCFLEHRRGVLGEGIRGVPGGLPEAEFDRFAKAIFHQGSSVTDRPQPTQVRRNVVTVEPLSRLDTG
jgi:hypothetical protein